jgi:type IX secretion system PorP/SprF family membrane protein
VGLSAPRLLNTDYSGDQDFQSLERISYYFTGGYVFDLSEEVKFKPATLLKMTNGAPLSLDLTANFLFFDKLWLGPAYRIDERAGSFGGLIDFQVSKQFRVGYSYEHPTSDLRPYTSGTHEILLMFELFKSKRIKSPRYF